jgi:hypothetical protein
MHKTTIFILLFFAINANSQITYNINQNPDKLLFPFRADSEYTSEKKIITPGAEYDAGWLHSVFFGAHWRDLWASPIEIGVFDMNKFAGGLTPVKRGGGLQSLSIQFKGSNGKSYKFRSVRKTTKRVIDPEFYGTVVEAILEDQLSIKHPLSNLIAPVFLNEVGVLNFQPKIGILPNDNKLNDFSEFKGLLGMIQEAPEKDEKASDYFPGAEKIINTKKFYKLTDKSYNDRVDAPEFLKAKLIDIFMSDWDRHQKQWLWASFKKGDLNLWKPIPMDRDEAFCRYDGFFPWLIEGYTPRFNGMGYGYPLMKFQTWEGRDLDRKFLASIDKPLWDSVTNYVISKLTNDVIDKAVRIMPSNWYSLKGAFLNDILKTRRDELKEASEEYYELTFDEPTIWLTDNPEFVEVNRIDNHKLDVTAYKKDENSSIKSDEVLFHRVFNDDVTSEVRIFLQGGDDIAIVKGAPNNNITVRVIGGEGKDKLIDSAGVNNPDPNPFFGANTIFYDHGPKTYFEESVNTETDKSKPTEPKNVLEKYNPLVQDFNYEWIGIPWLNYNTDEGFVFGGGPLYTQFGFRKSPFSYNWSFLLAYATKDKNPLYHFKMHVWAIPDKLMYTLRAKHTEQEFTRFYGYGNETVYDNNLYLNGYYNVKQYLFTIENSVNYWFTKKITLGAGITFNSSNINPDPNTLVGQNNYYGVNSNSYLGLLASFQYDSRDNAVSPDTGFYASITNSFYPKVSVDAKNYGKATLSLQFSYPIPFLPHSSFSLFAGAEKAYGDYPIYDAAFLGGINSLRGFPMHRLAGDASAFAGLETRIYLFNVSLVVPARFGLSLYGDAGRVFLTGETSKKIHTSLGGGIWFSFYRKAFILSIDAVKSKEKLMFYIGTKFKL